jgi:hypothetical protein
MGWESQGFVHAYSHFPCQSSMQFSAGTSNILQPSLSNIRSKKLVYLLLNTCSNRQSTTWTGPFLQDMKLTQMLIIHCCNWDSELQAHAIT